MCKERDLFRWLALFCFYLISLFLILICPLFLCWPLHVYNFHARKKQGSIAKELAGMATPLKFLGLLFLQFSDDFWSCWLGILAITASIYMKGASQRKTDRKYGWQRRLRKMNSFTLNQTSFDFEVFVCCCCSIQAYVWGFLAAAFSVI